MLCELNHNSTNSKSEDEMKTKVILVYDKSDLMKCHSNGVVVFGCVVMKPQVNLD